MVVMTMIGRLPDGLPLAASMPSDQETSQVLTQYQSQAKMLFRKLTNHSPARSSIESGNMMFHYILENSVCFLTLTDKPFSKRAAFSFLEDIASEFNREYGHQVSRATRPYPFIEFDTYMQKAKRNYQDSRTRRNLNRLNDELVDVQRVMVQNIDDVLQRGEQLSVLDDKAGNLRFVSEKYKKDAAYLNLRSAYAKYAALGIVCTIIIIYVRFWWF
ncbi:vesicle-trafficking protein SEC22b isoform X1 [Nematostella vectensis]|uniref:vesicle-trafficking protein SEC22b isoform X1 n=1 Tax=Nematostella vectensis TaxID=45351 RepID=UPI0020776E75|nr:vesicle-trafficking protein SEC22b isoform X1 [Nematostella vectensis]